MTTVPLNNTRTVDPNDATVFTISEIINTPQNLKRDRPSTSPEENDINLTIKQLVENCQNDKTVKKLKISNENCDKNVNMTQNSLKKETIIVIITSHGLTENVKILKSFFDF